MEGIPAEVVQIIARATFKGITQVRCKVTAGSQKGRVLIRNVLGPVKKGDVLMLIEAEMESAERIKVRR